MSRRARAEVLAQCLAQRFEDEGWEWNEVADWLVEEFLPTEHRLGRLKELLGVEGATDVTYDGPVDGWVSTLLDGLGLTVTNRQDHGRTIQVLVL